MNKTGEWLLLVMLLMVTLTTPMAVKADYPLEYSAEFLTNVGSGDFAPYYFTANNHGVITQTNSVLARGAISHKMEREGVFSYGFAADIIGGYQSATEYQYYDKTSEEFTSHNLSPSSAWLQQLYAEARYRALFLTVGMKQHDSALLNQQLSSGDMTYSGNSRPTPEVRAGFIDFQDIPFTKGWVQVQGELSFSKSMDSDWMESHYNYYNSFITTNYWTNYKRIYFRTKPEKALSLTIGMQATAMFGGEYRKYSDGELINSASFDLSLSDFITSIFPIQGTGNSMIGTDTFYEGNHLGSWDIVWRYRLKNNSSIRAYLQTPWEDGSGIGKLNGFDGLWGLEYTHHSDWYINGVVLEYIDLTNQCGAIHYAPNDHPDSPIVGEATGADDYYNNYMYNGYCYYGNSIGTPMIKSILYNTDGYLRITDNRIRGFHLGVNGTILPNQLSYRVLTSHRISYGTPFLPQIEIQNNTSIMVEGIYTPKQLPALAITAKFGIDSGNMYGNNVGAMLSVAYSGGFKL